MKGLQSVLTFGGGLVSLVGFGHLVGASWGPGVFYTAVGLGLVWLGMSVLPRWWGDDE